MVLHCSRIRVLGFSGNRVMFVVAFKVSAGRDRVKAMIARPSKASIQDMQGRDYTSRLIGPTLRRI